MSEQKKENRDGSVISGIFKTAYDNAIGDIARAKELFEDKDREEVKKLTAQQILNIANKYKDQDLCNQILSHEEVGEKLTQEQKDSIFRVALEAAGLSLRWSLKIVR